MAIADAAEAGDQRPPGLVREAARLLRWGWPGNDHWREWPAGRFRKMELAYDIWETFYGLQIPPAQYGEWAERYPQKAATFEYVEDLRSGDY